MDVPTSEDTHHALTESLTRIRIADIDHGDPKSTDGRFLEAGIILVWPYSTLTQEAGFLVAEKDALLRKVKGQVRISFDGSCAQEIAKLKAGVGDVLRISLESAHLFEERDEVSTPGKKAGFTIRYQDALRAEVLREDGQITLLSFQAPVTNSPLHTTTNSILATPRDQGLHDTAESEVAISASTPTFKTGSRLSSNSFPGSFIDPFISEDGSVAGRGRKRTKFGRHSGAWRLISNDEEEQDRSHELPSPAPSIRVQLETTTPTELREDTTVVTENTYSPQIPMEDSSEALVEEKTENAITEDGIPRQSLEDIDKTEVELPPMNVGSLRPSPERSIRIERPSFNSETVPTPRLQALASPGLSIVSPLIARSQYFPTFETTMSELDASSQQHDQSVFNDSSPNLDEPVEVERLVLDDPNQAEPILIDQDFEQTNAQAAFFPVATLCTDEVDLDALQEQIDMDNATPIPVEAVGEAIDDADMYGPPVTTSSIQSPIIEYPSLDVLEERSPEPATVPSDENSIFVQQRPEEAEVVEVTVDAPIETTQSTANSLPSFLDNAVKELEFFARDYEAESIVQEIEPAGLSVEETTSFPGQDPTGTHKPRSLDGMVDAVSVGFEQAVSQPPSTSMPEMGVEAIMPNVLPRSAETHSIPVTDFIENEVVDLISPQVADAPASYSLTEPVEEISHANEPAPIDEFAIVIDKSSVATDNLLRLPTTFVEDSRSANSSARRKSQRLLTKSPGLTGIYSEYFTPRKKSRPHGSSPIPVSSTRVPEELADVLLTAPDPPDIDPVTSNRLVSKPFTSSMTTELGHYVHLTQLTEYHNQVVDVIAVCVSDSTAPERAKSGPKDFHTTLQLVNASDEPNADVRVVAQIFRPRKNVLPHVRRGDVIILRGFLVQSLSRRPMLLSSDASAWAVFPSEDELRHDTNPPTIVSGPPIELGSGEESLAISLFYWWKDEGAARNSEAIKQINVDHDTLFHSKSERQPRKSKSELPAPLDLRRSPRKARQEQSQITALRSSDKGDRSPSFKPFSPTISQRSVQSSMAPPSAPAIDSPLADHSKQGQFLSDSMPPSLEEKSKDVDIEVAPLSDKKPAASRRHTRSASRASLDVSQHSPVSNFRNNSEIEDHITATETVDRQTSTPYRHNFSGSMSENNSVSGETTSSRRRRHERRSTSLIHELRDGTQWVDIEDSEMVSVSASESDDGQTHQKDIIDVSDEAQAIVNQDLMAHQVDANMGDAIEEAGSEQVELSSTPSRRGRGRPRRSDTQRSPASPRSSRHSRVLSHGSVSGVDESAVDTSPQGAIETRAQRVTRSRQKVAEQERNVHELRDGAKYTDR